MQNILVQKLIPYTFLIALVMSIMGCSRIEILCSIAGTGIKAGILSPTLLSKSIGTVGTLFLGTTAVGVVAMSNSLTEITLTDEIDLTTTTEETTLVAEILDTADQPLDDLNLILKENMKDTKKSRENKFSTTIKQNQGSTILAPSSTVSVPAKLPDALTVAATTIRTYLGMKSNITLSSKTFPASSSSPSSRQTRPDSSRKLGLPKPQKTDAPMLNYIFDSFSTANKHHHHDQRYGPHFEDIITDGNVTNITIQAGSVVYLNCRISLLQDKTVSWVKRKGGGEDALQLLTVGMHTYSGDNRYTMEFQYPNNWRLKISNAKKSDEGTYECQISTHPPRVIQINLHVNAPEVMIVDEYGAPLQEKYYEIDSTLQLSCIVRNVVMSSSVVFWSHGDQILNYDTTRGGVSLKTELMEDGANSTLFIARINKSDSGNYTCSINSSHEYSIMVHILNGESFAELHHGSCAKFISDVTITFAFAIILHVFEWYSERTPFLLSLFHIIR